jgi:hypothetical protein
MHEVHRLTVLEEEAERLTRDLDALAETVHYADLDPGIAAIFAEELETKHTELLEIRREIERIEKDGE